jgi:hypothetical protein
VCAACGAVLAEHGYFCPRCGLQARCKACNAVLVSDAQVCVMCGERIGAAGTSTVAPLNVSASSAVNSILLEETGSRRTLQAKFTDHAVESLGDALAVFMTGQLERRARQRQIDAPHAVMNAQPALPEGRSKPPVASGNELDSDTTGTDHRGVNITSSPNGKMVQLSDIFIAEGDDFKLDQTRVKATNKGDYTRRLIYLYLLAHKEAGRDRVPRKALNAILAEAGVYDSNARTLLSRDADLSSDGQYISMRVGARDAARQYLADLGDDSLTDK